MSGADDEKSVIWAIECSAIMNKFINFRNLFFIIPRRSSATSIIRKAIKPKLILAKAKNYIFHLVSLKSIRQENVEVNELETCNGSFHHQKAKSSDGMESFPARK